MTIRVLLVDGHRLVREALRYLLDHVPGMEVVGEAGDGQAALTQAGRLSPDVVVLDIGLPDLPGPEVAMRLRQAGCDARIVVLSACADKRFVIEMLRAGATACVTKSAASTELVRAIRAAAAGQSYFCPEVSGALVSQVCGTASPGEGLSLGRREREVLRLISEGMRTPSIAEELNIAVSTVEVHRRNIMRKLGLHTVADLTRHAIREGIVSL